MTGTITLAIALASSHTHTELISLGILDCLYARMLSGRLQDNNRSMHPVCILDS